MADPDFLRRLHAGFGVPRDEVIGFVEQESGSTVRDIERLTVGDENEVHRAMLAGTDRTLYVRIRRPGSGDFDAEVWAMERARKAGVPVPEVRALGEFGDDGVRAAMLIDGSSGRQLAQVLPTLTVEQRSTVLINLGQVLALLHTIGTPGVDRPDREGTWPDPDDVLQSFVAERLRKRPALESAGLAEPEIDRILALIGRSPDIPAPAEPVLNHGDLHPGHVFVDDRLDVCGVIDWGLWHGGSPIDDLSTMFVHYPAGDFTAILAGHGHDHGSDFERRLALATINQMVGHLAWSVSIENTVGTAHGVSVLRAALLQLEH